jgi:hypothetical protein
MSGNKKIPAVLGGKAGITQEWGEALHEGASMRAFLLGVKRVRQISLLISTKFLDGFNGEFILSILAQ